MNINEQYMSWLWFKSYATVISVKAMDHAMHYQFMRLDPNFKYKYIKYI